MSAWPTRRSSLQARVTAEPAPQDLPGQPRELSVALPNHPLASRLARRELDSFRDSTTLPDPEYESLRLLVSELVSNAVRHASASGRKKIGLRVRASGETIRIEVTDQGRGFDAPRVLPRPRNGSGYGLFIVDRLCSSWGVEHNGSSLVWCELERAA